MKALLTLPRILLSARCGESDTSRKLRQVDEFCDCMSPFKDPSCFTEVDLTPIHVYSELLLYRPGVAYTL